MDNIRIFFKAVFNIIAVNKYYLLANTAIASTLMMMMGLLFKSNVFFVLGISLLLFLLFMGSILMGIVTYKIIVSLIWEIKYEMKLIKENESKTKV